MLRASGLCDYVEGHDMAHGVQFPQYNLEPILEFADEYLKDVDFSLTEVEVDYAFATSNINRDMIVEFAEVTHIYGNKIPQPKFAFELNVSKDSIRIMGKKNNAVKFTVGGVDFLKFNAGKLVEFINSSSANIIQFTVIGRAQINEWMGRKTPQIMIDEMEYTAKELENLF
jgi:single-stranded-DNA-specific exonuclease